MTTSIFEKYAAVREKYPDDLNRIAEEEAHVKELLAMQDLSQHEGMLQLVAACRNAVITARKRLATDRSLLNDPEAQQELWQIVDARLWLLGLLARDFKGEIMMIEAGLEAELERV